jgi:hypothetical protein
MPRVSRLVKVWFYHAARIVSLSPGLSGLVFDNIFSIPSSSWEVMERAWNCLLLLLLPLLTLAFSSVLLQMVISIALSHFLLC